MRSIFSNPIFELVIAGIVIAALASGSMYICANLFEEFYLLALKREIRHWLNESSSRWCSVQFSIWSLSIFCTNSTRPYSLVGPGSTGCLPTGSRSSDQLSTR